MLPVGKVEIYFSKKGFVDCKRSNLPWSYTPWCHSLLRSTVGCPFLYYMQEKEYASCGLLKYWKFILLKYVHVPQRIQFKYPGVMLPLLSLTFGVHFGVHFSYMQRNPRTESQQKMYVPGAFKSDHLESTKPIFHK